MSTSIMPTPSTGEPCKRGPAHSRNPPTRRTAIAGQWSRIAGAMSGRSRRSSRLVEHSILEPMSVALRTSWREFLEFCEGLRVALDPPAVEHGVRVAIEDAIGDIVAVVGLCIGIGVAEGEGGSQPLRC